MHTAEISPRGRDHMLSPEHRRAFRQPPAWLSVRPSPTHAVRFRQCQASGTDTEQIQGVSEGPC